MLFKFAVSQPTFHVLIFNTVITLSLFVPLYIAATTDRVVRFYNLRSANFKVQYLKNSSIKRMNIREIYFIREMNIFREIHSA